METFKRQTLEFLKEEAKKNRSILISPEEWDSLFSSPIKPPPTSVDPMSDIRETVAKVLPNSAVVFTVPSDAGAKKKALLWEQQYLTSKIFILSLEEKTPSLSFLNNIAKALNRLSFSTLLLEADFFEMKNEWASAFTSPQLRFIVAPPLTQWKTTSLARLYCENRASRGHFLKGIPLLLLEPITTYLENPILKQKLWKTLSLLLSMST